MQLPDYRPALDAPPLRDDELQWLDAQLAALPDGRAMNIEVLDGYLTALLLAPQPLAARRGADWLPAVWGADAADAQPFASGKVLKRVVVMVLRHVHAIDVALRGDASAWEPVFSVAETDDGHEHVDAEDWCIGFLQAVAQDPDGWAPRFDDPALAAALVPLVLLGGDDGDRPPAETERLADPVERDALSRSVPDAVLALRALKA